MAATCTEGHTQTHTYLRMKPPLMAICSRSSTTRAPGWLFTTPSWFPPQAWPPPLILPHTHFSQGGCHCCIVCLSFCVCVCKCICLCICMCVCACLVVLYVCMCVYAGQYVWHCVCMHGDVNVCMHGNVGKQQFTIKTYTVDEYMFSMHCVIWC